MASRLKTSIGTLGFVFALLAFGGCKQGENEVCQVNDDCAAGLQCNENRGVCQRQVSSVVDAAPAPDAAASDATPMSDVTP